MIKIKLNGKTYKMPKRFTIDQWQQVLQLDLEDNKNWAKIMSIAFNKPHAMFDNVDEKSLVLGVSLIINAMSQRRECKLKDLTQLTIGEFIDLDIYLLMGPEKNIDTILDLILVKGTKWADEALWAVDQLANFRMSTYRQYSGLFDLDKNGVQEDVDPEDWDPQKVAKGWYRILVDLADDSLLNLDKITEQPLKKAFNFMALRKEKALEERERQLKQKRQHDLQRNRR